MPLDHEAIQYVKHPVDDPITRLQKQVDSGQVRLGYDDEHGYLKAVLKALDVPVESQVLVFSKTSFQAPKIAPRMPRALYYNDRVAVGFVRGGDVRRNRRARSQTGRHFLYARSGAGNEAQIRTARLVSAMPSIRGDTRRPWSFRFFRLSGRDRHAAVPERHDADQPNEAN